jgi:hypothetical protein
LYWTSIRGVGREALLHQIVEEATRLKWLGVFNNAWATWDVKLVGDLWHTLHIYTVTEELGRNQRFTRARIEAQPTRVNRAVSFGALAWTAAALFSMQPMALALALISSALALMQNFHSRQHSLRAATSLVAHAGHRAGLRPVNVFEPTAIEPTDAEAAPISAVPDARVPELASSS